MNDQGEAEGVTLTCIQHALDDAWPDGKRRPRLKQAMTDRIARVRQLTGYQTVEALRAGDYEIYARFLGGCRRALIRDQLIESGHLGPDELRRMRAGVGTRDLHALSMTRRKGGAMAPSSHAKPSCSVFGAEGRPRPRSPL